MSRNVPHVQAVDLAAEVTVDAQQFRRKLRTAAVRGYIKHHKHQRWTVSMGSDDHGVMLAVLRQVVGYHGASRLLQLEQEYTEMRGRRPPELPPL